MNIPAGLFKAKCLQLIDDINKTHEEIVITKYGKPVAKLVPLEKKGKSLFGYMKGTVSIHGDIIAGTGEKWNANA